MSISFIGYKLFEGALSECTAQILAELSTKDKACKVFACLNPHSFVLSRSDPEFQSALKSVTWLVPDGVGIVLALRILGLGRHNRVTGPDTFMSVMRALNHSGRSAFFLGSTEDNLAEIILRAKVDFPNVKIVGTYSPPFKECFSIEDNLKMVSAINSASPDVLWVGMTAPKQEKWLQEHSGLLNVHVAGAIGAAFDFYTGNVWRSPKFIRDNGFEWLVRLFFQPHKIWRRIIFSSPSFLYAVILERIRRL